MSLYKLILKSAWFYRKLNLTIILGIALSTAILVGALIIGDSVKYSLQQITVQRLGKTSQVITAGERLFGQHLATKLAEKTGVETAALLRANGFGVIDGGDLRINQLAVWGVDATIGNFVPYPELFQLQNNEVAINENLALFSGLKCLIKFKGIIKISPKTIIARNIPFPIRKINKIPGKYILINEFHSIYGVKIPAMKNKSSVYNGSQYAIVSILLKRWVKYFLIENQ